MTPKYQRARKKISLINEKKENFENNIKNKTNLNSTNDKYPIQFKKPKKKKLLVANKIIYLFIKL